MTWMVWIICAKEQNRTWVHLIAPHWLRARARDELCGIFIYASESMPSADDKTSLVTRINSISVSENDNGEHWRSNWHFGIGIIELRVIFNDFLAGIFFSLCEIVGIFFSSFLCLSVDTINGTSYHSTSWHSRLSNQFTHTILLVTIKLDSS